MKTTAPTIIGNDCLNIQETSVCHSMNANCHNKAKRIIDAKARIIKPTQNSCRFSPLNNIHQANTSTSSLANRFLDLGLKPLVKSYRSLANPNKEERFGKICPSQSTD